MSSNHRLFMAALLLLFCSLFVGKNECKHVRGKLSKQSENDMQLQDLRRNDMNIEETQEIPELFEVHDDASNVRESPETNQNTDGDQSINSSDIVGVDETETASAESGPMAQYHNGPDLRASASHHHHGHGVKGWLDMGAWTGKKGAFGWYDKHPVGKGK